MDSWAEEFVQANFVKILALPKFMKVFGNFFPDMKTFTCFDLRKAIVGAGSKISPAETHSDGTSNEVLWITT